jgi:hypothetical protein
MNWDTLAAGALEEEIDAAEDTLRGQVEADDAETMLRDEGEGG